MSSASGLVQTASGQLRGTELDGLLVWRGIPYGAAPSGPLRFRPPQPPQAWTGVRSATEPGPVAWQSEAVNPFTGAPAELNRDEDCLYVNVTAPARPSPDPAGYPVLVWVHGGGYVQGSGASDLVGDAARLAAAGDAQARLCVATANAWAAFAAGQPPAAAGLPGWPRFDAADEQTMILDPAPRLARHPRQAEFDLWSGRDWQSGTWWPLTGPAQPGQQSDGQAKGRD